MNEKDLIKKSIEENILSKEKIRLAAISSGSSLKKEIKGVEFIMKKKITATAFVVLLCVVSVATLIQKPSGTLGAYDNPSDYGQIYALLNNLDDNTGFFDWFGEKAVVDNAAEGDGITNGEDGKTTPDYSDTNLQVAGVQEADIIKTDGEYIYALSWEYLYILKTDNGNLTLVSKMRHLTEGDDGTTAFFEMYVTGDKLIALKRSAMVYAYDMKVEEDSVEEPSSGDGTGAEPGAADGSSSDPGTGDGTTVEPPDQDPGLQPEPVPIDIMPIWPGNESTVTAVVFDISDKNAPAKLNQLGQKGEYVSSRMIDDQLYLVTNYYVYLGAMEKQDVSTYVPTTVEEGKDEQTIRPEDIYIAPNPESGNYVTISGIDVSGKGEFVSSKAIMGSASNVFASLNNLYVTNYDSVSKDGYYTDKTAIIKFTIDDGKVEKAATGSVYGSIINQFSMDEQDGNFRIATTITKYQEIRDGDTVGISEGTTTNSLYVLDGNLKMLGQLNNLAEGERIYSVRFDGDIGYIVTYKQVDPLFAIDLANPEAPKVLSALKIPGFSEYMQPFGDGLLFGLGKKTNADGMVVGLKLSMFDVSDKADVTEASQYVLSEEYLWTEASWNHKSILVSAERNLIAFPSFDSYFVFEYHPGDGFKLLKQVKISAESLAAGYYYGTMRGLYIDDVLYVYTGSEMIALGMDDYGVIETLKLN